MPPRADPTADTPPPTAAALKTATCAALCRTEKHDDNAPFRPQMARFSTSLNADDARFGKILSGPDNFAAYARSFASDAKRAAFGVSEPDWLRMQAQIAVLLRSRFEPREESDTPPRGLEKIDEIWPADGDLTSDEADGLGSRAYLALCSYYEAKSQDEIFDLEGALDAARWGDEHNDEPLSVYIARLKTKNARISRLDPTSPAIRDARWLLDKTRRALSGLTRDNAGGARDIYAVLGEKLDAPRDYPKFAPSLLRDRAAASDENKAHLAALETEIADCERRIEKAKTAPPAASDARHALFSSSGLNKPAALCQNPTSGGRPDDKSNREGGSGWSGATLTGGRALNSMAPPTTTPTTTPTRGRALRGAAAVGAALRGEMNHFGRPFFTCDTATCWNCGVVGHTVYYCREAAIGNGQTHKPADFVSARARRDGSSGANNGPAANSAVAFMAPAISVSMNATDPDMNKTKTDYLDGGSSHSLYGDIRRAVPGSLVPHVVPIKTPNSTTHTEYKGTVIIPIKRNDGSVLYWTDKEALFASSCGNLGLQSESRLLEAGVAVLKIPGTDGRDLGQAYLVEGRALREADDPRSLPLARCPTTRLFQIPGDLALPGDLELVLNATAAKIDNRGLATTARGSLDFDTTSGLNKPAALCQTPTSGGRPDDKSNRGVGSGWSGATLTGGRATLTLNSMPTLTGGRATTALNSISLRDLIGEETRKASGNSRVVAQTTSRTPNPHGATTAGRVALWQARLGFPPPLQLESILGATTGHGIPVGAALDHARPLAIWRLANQNATPKRAVSRHKPAPRRVTFAPESEAEEPRPYLEFEAWSLDWQEFAPSVTGHKYALNFVEHKHKLLYSIYVPDTGNKTTIAAFDAHRGYVRSERQSEVRYYWHDADTTLLSKPVGEYFAQAGIKSGHSPPYKHERNDKIERKHKPAHRLSVILRYSGRLPPKFWPRSHATAVEIINITPTSALDGMSPLQSANKGEKPDISHLRRFGCPVSVIKQHRSKRELEFRSRPSINLGTSPGCPGAHIILDVKNVRTMESADLVFDESFDYLTITEEPGRLTGNVRSSADVVDPFTVELAAIEDDPADFEFYGPVIGGQAHEDAPAVVNDGAALGNGDGAVVAAPPVPFADDDDDVAAPPVPPVDAGDDGGDAGVAVPIAPPESFGAGRFPVRQRGPPPSVPLYLAPSGDLAVSDLTWLSNENTVAHAAHVLDMFHPTYVEFPGPGVISAALRAASAPRRALRLLKGLYGTKQGGMLWHRRFKAALRALGFTPTASDPCCFQHWDRGLCAFAVVWVDDSFITGSDREFIKFAGAVLEKLFGGKMGEINSFLGMHIVQNIPAGMIHFHHSSYRRNIFERFGISPEIQRQTPDSDGLEWDTERGPLLLANYRNITAAWMFDAITCAPWAMKALNRLCKNMTTPTQKDAIQLDAFMRFMAAHIDEPLVYRQYAIAPGSLSVDFWDSSFADKDDAKLRSTSGVVGYTAGNITNYKCSTQSTTAKATNEAELIAASTGTNEAVHKRNLLCELSIFDVRFPGRVYVDNAGVAQIANRDTGLTFRNKHLATKAHNLADYVENRELKVDKVASKANPADFLTKTYPGAHSAKWVEILSGQAVMSDMPAELVSALGIAHTEPTACEPEATDRKFEWSGIPDIKDPEPQLRPGEVRPGKVTIDADHPEIVKILRRLPPEYRHLGLEAMQLEMETLNDYGTWAWSDAENKPLDCKLFEKVKYKGDGTFDKVKMRNVVRGFMQVEGIDFGATYSPTGMISTVRLLFALAVHDGWPCYEYDAKNAYCHGVMDVDLWVMPPAGVHIAEA